jgi:hypothetical protein
MSFAVAFCSFSLIASGHGDSSNDEYWFGNQNCSVSNPTPCASDGLLHTYCWGGDFDGDSFRDAARYAMNNLEDQTAFRVSKLDNCTDGTDIIWRTFNGALGQYDCIRDAGSRCASARVFVNPGDHNGLPDAQTERKHTTCHELGHSGGLRHYAPGAGGDDCMRSDLGNQNHTRYNGHHRDHLNQN